jgi:tRNA A-37 threonylcarbamoyl transferase component Bud32/TolB-like protein
MELTRGTLVSGYEILEPLGRGGQSTVYKALDVNLRRVVAIKFLGDQHLADEMSQKRFLLEARALSSLNHPNIATVYHIGQLDVHPFIVMEYVEGTTLLEHLREREDTAGGQLDQKLALMIQIVEAVAYAHHQGILHRDLKPGNILVTPEGRVKLVDFGLAKLIQSSLRDRLSVAEEFTTTGSILGTVSYLSPEQARSETIDERSDLFSLGIIFYELLAGRRPYASDTPVSALVAIVQSAPAAFPDTAAVPTALQRVIFRLLEKKPGDRFQSAPELLAALRGSAGLPADTTVRFAPPPPRRNRRRVQLLVAGAVLLAAVLAAGWFLLRPSEPAPPGSSRITLFVYPVRSDADEKSRFLADLISGEVISTLGRSPDLRILYLPEGSERDAAAADKVLQRENVRYVIDGSLLLAGDQLKVSMKMIDRTDSSIRWSDSLRGAITDVYDIPAQIAASVAFVAGVYVSAEKMNFPGREAFDLYTQGDILLRRYDPAQLGTAIEYFQKCIQVAPDFLPAYARIVFGYLQYRNQGVSYDPAYLDEARDYIRQGLAKDPRSPALLTALAWYHLYTYDYAAAAAVVRQIEQDGGRVTDEKLRCWIQFYGGDGDRALDTLELASAANPLDATLPLNKVVLSAMLGRRDVAAAAIQDFEQMNSSELTRGVTQGWWQIASGDLDAAARIFDDTYNKHQLHLLALACAEAEFARGDYGRSRHYLDLWLDKNPYALEGHWLRGLCLAGLGDAAGRRAAAKEARHYAELLAKRYGNPSLAVYVAYFSVQAGEFSDGPAAVRSIDTQGQDAFTRYLQSVTLAALGDHTALEGAPTPYSPIYWLNRFSKIEIDELKKVR